MKYTEIETITEIDGIPVRALSLEVATDLYITILDTPDVGRLDEAIHDTAVDPYATTLWPASLAVAMELPDLISPGDQVLDLGSGTGLATLTAARLGAYATAYDHDPFALRLIEEAARMQGLSVETIEFDLHSPEPLPPADLIILADLFYDYDLADSLARRVVGQVLSGGRAIIGDPGRVATSAFLDYLGESGIYAQYHSVEVSPPGENDQMTSIGIYIFGD
jgi:predicted nicotinamide N-methyase